MTYKELQEKAKYYDPIVMLDRLLIFRRRRLIRTALGIIIGLIFIGFIFIRISTIVSSLGEFASSVSKYEDLFQGLLLISLAIWLVLYLIEAMYSSYYFSNGVMDPEVAKVIHFSEPHDVTKGFVDSRIGKLVFARLGLGDKDIDEFYKERINTLSRNEYELINDKEEEYISLADFGRSLIHFDMDLKRFFDSKKVTAEMFRGALRFVATTESKIRNERRWWTRDALSRIPSLGRNWSYGKIFYLEKYGHSMMYDTHYVNLGNTWRMYMHYIGEIERSLLKQNGANVMIVSESNETGMVISAAFGKAITSGEITHSFEHYRTFVIDAGLLIDSSKEKLQFEITFRKILDQAAKAGNVILVIPNMVSLIENAHTLDSDIVTLLTEVLSSSRVNVIAIAHTGGFHQSIETNRDLMQHFEKVSVKELGNSAVLSMLQHEALRIEKETGLFFTFQSLQTMVDSADRYLSHGELADKSVDLLEEVGSRVASSKRVMVLSSDVEDIVESKTGIPLGELTGVEREAFKNLEAVLHTRIVGQDEAVVAVASALRRARSGIQSKDRPMGTFLFLGPTGVGKTETAKALSEAFFEDEENIIRFDMSEFATPDALEKLIGGKGETGIMAKKLREHQYGVLLLDEFEKTTPKVLNLFLQMFDEGFFTDSRGEKINARNLIIIATSNAGSEMIYEAGRLGEDVSLLKDKIIDMIIKNGIYRPELLNRFDDVVIFHSLDKENLHHVAIKMLEGLNHRLSNKGIEIEVSDDLVKYLVEKSHDPKFGARAMRREIQDVLESKIADGLVEGSVTPGHKVRFSITDSGQLILLTSE